MNSSDLFHHAVELARAGQREAARDAFLRVVEDDPANELAWMWLAGLVDSLEDRIIACENILTINPSNKKVRAHLAELYRQRGLIGTANAIEKQKPARQNGPKDPMREAKYLEQEGKFDQALMIYKVEAAKAGDTNRFNEIYRNIIRLEELQFDRIRYVAPRASIIRMTFTWPLLYLSFALVQIGLNPWRDPASYLWFAFPWVIAGSYLVAVSEVRVRHIIWKRVFLEEGDGSALARAVVGAVGWFLVLIPMALILVDSLNRLSRLVIPPRPF